MTRIRLIFSIFIITMMSCKSTQDQDEAIVKDIDYNELSEDLLEQIKQNKNTENIEDILAKTSLKNLESSLDTDAKKLAFWTNIYNAYIQLILKKNPDLYKDRGSFFKKEQITIAGEKVSFAEIEHGILRKSQWEYGLGYIRKWFPGKLERRLRVNKRDYRIHFALNCGAKDCPPVAIYEWERVNEQFDKGTKAYLSSTTDYNDLKKEASVTSLFSWFRGDFGGESGIKKILKQNDLIPTTKNIDLVYKNYDWTLDLDNFIDL
ncbi:DUF547 domain-containing protein [Maribacter sp. MMG018]|uniref:DUF547 domain-containing protein n=1 Tax=Maribacter sp. MMG018 TaxID=2822688 RepID=UPI001FFDE37E|nr:DUF547 domain-containing protein [Maribacter sp. MMG018]